VTCCCPSFAANLSGVKTRGLFIAAVVLLLFGLPATASAQGGRLTASERRQIDATLNSFVNHVVKRQDIDAGYGSVTPAFRLGMTREQWDRGSLPGIPYPAAGKNHGWVVTYRHGNELGIEVVLQPQKGSGVGAGSFPMTMKRIHGKWLVDSMVPGAFFAPEGKKARVVGTNDFQAQGDGSGGGGGSGTQRVPADFAYVPFAIFGVIVLILVSAALIGGFRWRKVRDGLPPLPERMRTRT
jgi:hypothetical protein